MFVLWRQLYAISIVFLLSESNLSDFLGLGRGSQSSAGIKCKLRRGVIPPGAGRGALYVCRWSLSLPSCFVADRNLPAVQAETIPFPGVP